MTCLWILTTAVCLTLPWTAHSSSSSSSSSPPSSNTNPATNDPPSALEATRSSAVITPDPSSSTASSQPLRTLKKLQAMLDETDYVTESANLTRIQTAEDSSTDRGDIDSIPIQPPINQQAGGAIVWEEATEKASAASLWTSKDRSKYKRQQQLQNEKRIAPQESEDGTNSGTEDATDDGLGYTLPTLPIYLSDGEISTEDEDAQEERQDGHSINTTTPTTFPTQQHQLRNDSSTQSPHLTYNSPTAPVHTSSQPFTVDSTSQQTQYSSPPTAPFAPYPWNYFYPPMYSNMNMNPPPYSVPTPLPPYPTSATQPQSSWTSAYPPYYYGNPYPQPLPNYPNYIPPTQHSQSYPSQLQQQQQQEPRYPMDDFNPTNTNSQPSNPMYRAKSLVANSIHRQQQQQIYSQTPYFIPNPSSLLAKNTNVISTSPPVNPSTMPVENIVEVSSQDSSSLSSSSPMLVPSSTIVSSSSSSSSSFSSPQMVSAQSASTIISLDSVQKIFIVLGTVAIFCYCAVSPRTLDTLAYNMEFQKNIQRVGLAWIPPFLLILLGIVNREENNINSMIHSFYTSFTIGYVSSFLLEIITTTILRLCVFALWEPSIFSLTPQVPILILPWTVREFKYRPKRITLFLADVITSCVAAPLIEEGMKLILLLSCVNLPKNFQWRRIIASSNKKGGKSKRKWICEALSKDSPHSSTSPNITNINSYISHMLMISLGLKLSDSTRRILMYTKSSDQHKAFYSFCRGIFPIHELCGVMTALQLAKRDILGMNMETWKILLPALVIHGMANFRGFKPMFKWKSSTPWSEMQLTSFKSSSSWIQMITLNFPRIMWLIILFRVLGYCIKNYYMIGRQAIKRTTTYAGKHSAFSAELAAAEMLKRK